jgi:membrane dipeptidase
MPGIHASAVVIDGHNDSLCRRLDRGDALDLTPAAPGYHVDLPRLREGGMTALLSYCGSTDLARALHLTEATHRMVAAHPAEWRLVLRAADIPAAKAAGQVAIVLQLESLTCCMGRVPVLQGLYRLGVRVGNITHGEAPEHGCQGEKSLFDYCTAEDRERMRREMKGLTAFGREAIAEMNALGMVVDLAHSNDAAFYEALELTATPPIFSHGGVFSLCPHSRGLTDDQIRALAAKGGVHGVACYAKFIAQEHATLGKLLDQIEHSISLVGPDHVGIGADYDGIGDEGVAIPAHVGLLGEITEGMVARGWGDEIILKVLGANFVRVFEQVL